MELSGILREVGPNVTNAMDMNGGSIDHSQRFQSI